MKNIIYNNPYTIFQNRHQHQLFNFDLIGSFILPHRLSGEIYLNFSADELLFFLFYLQLDVSFNVRQDI